MRFWTKVIEFVDPDKIEMETPAPGLGEPSFKTWRDWFRFMCFCALLEAPIALGATILIWARE